MCWIGNKFVASLGLSIKPGYCRLPDLRNRRHGDAFLEVVTAFHPALPWDNNSNTLGTVADNCRCVLTQVVPDVVLGTAHTGKERSLRNLLGGAEVSKLADVSSDGLSDFGDGARRSRFYANGIPIADGFEYPAASSDSQKSLRRHSRYRFSLPQAVLVEKVADGYVKPLRLGATAWSRARGLEIIRQERQQAAQRAKEEKRQREEQEAKERAAREAREAERREQEAKERAEWEAREKERREQEAKERAARRAREDAKWAALTAAAQSNKSVTVNVSLLYRNSGGWVVDYEGTHGFMPQSHSGEYRNRDDRRVDDVAVAVLEVEPPGQSHRDGNFVVSRRRVVESRDTRDPGAGRRRRSETKRAAWQGFSAVAGDSFEGEVSGIADFGIFVRLESGVEGLAHISTLGGSDGLAQYAVGQRVSVAVLSVDSERMRLGLRIVSV